MSPCLQGIFITEAEEKEDFYNAHTADLILYYAAVKFLKRNFNHGKLPVVE